MWFKVIFYSDLYPISAAIAPDGQVYFKASDVGKLLRYVSAHNFATRYATRDLNRALPLTNPTKKCLVFTFEEMMLIIDKQKHKYQTPVNTNEMMDLWLNGRVDEPVPPYPTLNFKYAPTIYIRKDGEYNIQDWVQEYRNIICKNYARIADAMDYLYEQPPSVRENLTMDDDESTDDTDEKIQDPVERESAMDDDDKSLIVSSDPRIIGRPPPTPTMADDKSFIRPTYPADPRIIGRSLKPAEPSFIRPTYPSDPRLVARRSMIYPPPQAAAANSRPPMHNYPDPRQIMRSSTDGEPMRSITEATTNNYSPMSPEPDQIHDLKMDFDAFPPDRIYIQFHGTSYKYSRDVFK